MICRNCGTLNPEDAVFCIECGKNLNEFGVEKVPKIEIKEKIGINNFTESRDVKKCPYCSEEIKAEAIKCKHCGEWLSSRPNNSQNLDLEFSYGLPILHLVLFDILTLGLYGSIYWFYRNWKHFKVHKNLDISPGLRTVGLFIPIVGIVMVYEQFKDIKNFAEEVGVETYSSPGSLTLGLVVLGFLTIRSPDPWWIITWALALSITVYVQNNLNKYWAKEQAGIPLKEGFSNTEIILMVISGVFIVFILLALFFG